MTRFVSTFESTLDSKGRVSVPASFRAVLAQDAYRIGSARGLYCYPSLDAPAVDAGGERLAQKIDALLAALPDYSVGRNELSVALYGDVQVIAIDRDGRIVVPPGLRAHAAIEGRVTFVGLGEKFQIWEPKRFAEQCGLIRTRVSVHRQLIATTFRGA